MCEICEKAAKELASFLETLEEKYPGSEVDGVKVPRGHHVFYATQINADMELMREMAGMAKLEQENEKTLEGLLVNRELTNNAEFDREMAKLPAIVRKNEKLH